MKCFIIPYIGKIGSFSQLSLETLSANVDKLFVFTNDTKYQPAAKNIEVVLKNLEELSELASNALRYKIVLNTPYKLCDLKPFYGVIFNEWVKDYDTICFGDSDCIYSSTMKQVINDFEAKHKGSISVGGDRGHFMLMTKDFSSKMPQISKNYFGDKLLSKIITSPKNFAFDEFEYLHKMLEHLANSEEIIWDRECLVDHVDISYWRREPLVRNRKISNIDFQLGSTISVVLDTGEAISPSYIHIQKRKVYVCDDFNEITAVSFDNKGSIHINGSGEHLHYDDNINSNVMWKVKTFVMRIKAKIFREKIIK